MIEEETATHLYSVVCGLCFFPLPLGAKVRTNHLRHGHQLATGLVAEECMIDFECGRWYPDEDAYEEHMAYH